MRALALLFLLCLSVDFSNPLLPGALRLDDGETVHGSQPDRSRIDDLAIRVAATRSPALDTVPVIEPAPRPPQSGEGWAPRLAPRRAFHPVSRDPAPSTDDH